MGPPPKPFLEISQRQQQRRTRALLETDLQNIRPENVVNKIPLLSNPHASLTPLVVQTPDKDIPEHEHDCFAGTIKLFDAAADLDAFLYDRSASSIDAEIQMDAPARYSITDSNTSSGLRPFLAHWAIKNKISQVAVNELLGGLQKFGNFLLPSDARTLCATPRIIHIRSIAGGNYSHYGLENALRDHLRRHIYDTGIPPVLHININVDGVPLSKSSKSNLWPILGKVVGAGYEPFLIGAFHGNGKPFSPAEFLDEFLTEYRKLYNEGIAYKNRRYLIRLNAVIADTPARNFISCFPAHNSRCAKCTQLGKTLNGRRIFTHPSPTLRTNETFRDGLPAPFQGIVSPFETIGLDMIKQFPLDYMHLLCLGVMKKLLLLWINNMGKSKEALAKIATFNSLYTSLAQSTPSEFSRQPRSLDELARWKATEFRLFLLYLGPVVLQYFLTKPEIIHFNALNCAVRILCDPRECVRNNKYAQDLMLYFVENIKLLYGEETLVYNVHNLIHLPVDVLTHGHLDEFSCFPFENFLQTIKLLIKGGAQPLAQVMKRITERSTHLVRSANNETAYRLAKRKNRADPAFLDMEGCTDPHREIQFPDFTLTDKAPNNCCYMQDNSVVLIEHICYLNGIPVIIGRKFINPASIPNYPCDSRTLCIFKVRTLSERHTWTINLIDRKGFPVWNDADSLFVCPLIHCGV